MKMAKLSEDKLILTETSLINLFPHTRSEIDTSHSNNEMKKNIPKLNYFETLIYVFCFVFINNLFLTY